MLKKTPKSKQLDIFSSTSSLFSGKSLNIYEDDKNWHNIFRKEVLMRIDESIFAPLYSKDQGRPNASIRVLVGMMILKEGEGISDEKLFENCRYNLLIRSSLGIFNINETIPAEWTYYLLRKNIVDYEKEHGINLFSKVFSSITKGQCTDFQVSGQRVRMDSKLIGSNIAWLSRYELIHNTLKIFYKIINKSKIEEKLKEKLDNLLELDGNKVVYTQSTKEVKTRLEELGSLINEVLKLEEYSNQESYQVLQRLFTEQYKINEEKIVIPKEKEEITSNSIQSPYDTECAYRNKGGQDGTKKQTVKGYNINITETCDQGNLILKILFYFCLIFKKVRFF